MLIFRNNIASVYSELILSIWSAIHKFVWESIKIGVRTWAMLSEKDTPNDDEYEE